jgi:hypothetical protein
MQQKQLKADLLLPWIFTAAMVFMLAVYVFICLFYGNEVRLDNSGNPPVLIRSILYIVAIVTFPLTNLIRHIMLRLNQTMPGDTPARSRYLITVLVSLSMAESLGIYGLILFLLGDEVNSLYIFSVLAVLAIYLYRPKLEEYTEIVEALKSRES